MVLHASCFLGLHDTLLCALIKLIDLAELLHIKLIDIIILILILYYLELFLFCYSAKSISITGSLLS